MVTSITTAPHDISNTEDIKQQTEAAGLSHLTTQWHLNHVGWYIPYMGIGLTLGTR